MYWGINSICNKPVRTDLTQETPTQSLKKKRKKKDKKHLQNSSVWCYSKSKESMFFLSWGQTGLRATGQTPSSLGIMKVWPFPVHPYSVLPKNPVQTQILPTYSYPFHWQCTFLLYLKTGITTIILFFHSKPTWVVLTLATLCTWTWTQAGVSWYVHEEFRELTWNNLGLHFCFTDMEVDAPLYELWGWFSQSRL